MDTLANVEKIECTEAFPVRRDVHLKTTEEYVQLYEKSIQYPAKFWREIACDFFWKTPLPEDDAKLFDYNFDLTSGPIRIDFLKGTKTNISYNLLDRIIEQGKGNTVAYHWEGNELGEQRSVTYLQLLDDVCRAANGLRELGIKEGDRVAIYMPMTIELVVAMLACARIGAIHTVVFAGFSSKSLAERMICANCRALIIADAGFRGEKLIHIQPIADAAVTYCLESGLDLKGIVVHERFANSTNRNRSEYADKVNNYNGEHPNLYKYWSDMMSQQSNECEPEWLDAEHPLFILYTSGSTGKPKGVVHTVGGYMLTTALVFKYAFNYRPGDIMFCTADLGWITGHTANVYGPLANGATCVLFEGTPCYPTPARFWQIIDQYRVSSFYTAPTAVRSLMKYGDKHLKPYKMDSLKVLALVGEPINGEAWRWFFEKVGSSRCPIVDTYFQTETGAPMIFPIPGTIAMKPGSATVPFFGIAPAILDENGREVVGTEHGFLGFKQAWPGIARTVDGNHERFEQTYFEKFTKHYFTGDGAFRDEDGFIWITGRTDDLLNVSGHLLSTAEVESAILNDKRVSEVAAVPMPHAVKGQCIVVYLVTKNGYQFDEKIAQDVRLMIRKTIGPVATPDIMMGVRGLPKTRSGKIMRRVLAKIARQEDDFGDISTIIDETIIDDLIEARRQINPAPAS